MFFVISGYVITASIEERADTPLIPFLSAFYRRRIQRLAPALICCIAITGVLTCLFVNNPDSSLITGATALVGVSNLYLLGESTNYFSADASYNTFLQTWSLGVEEQFYLCFPVLAWWLLQRQRKGDSSPALPVLATLSLISLLSFIFGSSNNPASAYFLTPMRLWELLAGALIQQGILQRLRLPALAPMGMLLLSFWLTNDPIDRHRCAGRIHRSDLHRRQASSALFCAKSSWRSVTDFAGKDADGKKNFGVFDY